MTYGSLKKMRDHSSVKMKPSDTIRVEDRKLPRCADAPHKEVGADVGVSGDRPGGVG
jgi:hypothetical protein